MRIDAALNRKRTMKSNKMKKRLKVFNALIEKETLSSEEFNDYKIEKK